MMVDFKSTMDPWLTIVLCHESMMDNFILRWIHDGPYLSPMDTWQPFLMWHESTRHVFYSACQQDYIKNKIMTRNVFPDSHVQSDLLLICSPPQANERRELPRTNAMLGGVSEENDVLGWRPEHAWTRWQETTATAGTFPSLIGLRPAAFWGKI